MKKKTLKDIAIFAKIISASVLLAGFVLIGLFVAKKLEALNYPPWINLSVLLIIVAFGLWQAWLAVNQTLKKITKRKEDKL